MTTASAAAPGRAQADGKAPKRRASPRSGEGRNAALVDGPGTPTQVHAGVSSLASVAAQAMDPARIDQTLHEGLAALRSVVACDLAVLYEHIGDELVARAAEGPLVTPRVRNHRLQLSRFPTIRRALDLRRPIPLEEHHHAGDEGDPYDGVLDLPHGHGCMVIPLSSGVRTLGIITLDRAACGVYSRQEVDLAAAWGATISIAMAFAEQAKALERARAQVSEEKRLLEQRVHGEESAAATLGRTRSEAMLRWVRILPQVAQSDVSVLVLGETGTGKELVARALHEESRRAGRPFVALNCAAIPEALVESELFGHVRGAFSGAAAARAGRFATADGGTLFLDEIGDMPLGLQAKLLRVLQEGQYAPVGSDRSAAVDVRVISATHVDLLQAVRAGRFREDLYYRLAIFPIEIPPLRARPDEDVLNLARILLDRIAKQRGQGPWTLSASAAAALARQAWPGNVRELLNCLERATILQPRGVITPAHLALRDPPAREDDVSTARSAVRASTQRCDSIAAAPSSSGSPASVAAERVARGTGRLKGGDLALMDHASAERAYFERVLEATGGKIYGAAGAAAITGLPPTTLQSKLRKLGVTRQRA